MADSARRSSRTALDEVSSTGAFERLPSTFSHWIGRDPGFPAEPNRYALYISYACPWASRCLAALNLKGLEDIIKVYVSHAVWARTRPDDPADDHCGWVMRKPSDPPISNPAGHGAFSCESCIPDDDGTTAIRDLYERCGEVGKYTVPVLWDTKTKCIVNNESAEIVRMFNREFNAWAKNPALDLCPADRMPEIEAINDWVYPNINNGVYRCGFAKSQEAYDKAVDDLFGALDHAEQLLDKRRFLAGSRMTEADIRLFVTLIRFDEVYVVYFKTNRRCIREYPNLLNYTREIYQMPEVKASVNFQHIKHHYFASHPVLNAYAVVPSGPGTDIWDQPHDRAQKFAS